MLGKGGAIVKAPMTQTGKIVAALIEEIGERKDVYTAAGFSESALARIVNDPKPPGKTLLEKLCASYPAYGPRMLAAWVADRRERDLRTAAGIQSRQKIEMGPVEAGSDYAIAADRVAGAIDDADERKHLLGLLTALEAHAKWRLCAPLEQALATLVGVLQQAAGQAGRGGSGGKDRSGPQTTAG